jgi:glycerol-3-phosphate acyltransferase PlsX
MPESRIALDVMGGDHAPGALLEGALLATTREERPLTPERILLVGDEVAIEAWFADNGGNPGFPVQHASQVIEMDDSPAKALRAKRDSSIGGCVKAIRGGLAGALVCMGNTGACVGASTLGLGTLEGVRRPGIAITLRMTGHPVTMMDMGANIASKPEHLLQYGVMGNILMRDMFGFEETRIGLLNIGEEASKGTDLCKESHALLSKSSLNFIGNVEGPDIFNGAADVVVTDGYTGNITLKMMEGLSGYLMKLVVKEVQAHGADWTGDVISALQRNTDYAEYGGALLLGVNGTVVIGHGRSDGLAVANAIDMAARALKAKVNQHIVEGCAAFASDQEASSEA